MSRYWAQIRRTGLPARGLLIGFVCYGAYLVLVGAHLIGLL